ncbi:MAG: type 4a pilus biogenesis protein PilO, partial [Fibrobacter sp.]|nr:type 4a pilus biogenesis protein PilO [Fibrobacter sp.]
ENHYNISVEGGYHDLAEFFAFLANFTLIINLSSVKIATHSGLERGITQDMLDGSPVMTIESSFEMTTFSSKK